MAYSSVKVTISQGWRILPPLKGTPKDPQDFGPYQISPFVVATTTRKEASTLNAPMGAIPPKAVTNHFFRLGKIEQQRLQR